MPNRLRTLVAACACALGLVSPLVGPAAAQYSEVPQPLPVGTFTPFGDVDFRTAVQIGRRLFVGGDFTALAAPTGAATVLAPSGAVVPGAFPSITGQVSRIVNDGRGGWIVVGAFTSVEGKPFARAVRIRADRHVDPGFLVDADGSIDHVVVAHGRAYLAGGFRVINGQRRGSVAAFSLDTNGLTDWAKDFDPGPRVIAALDASSVAVYVAANQNYQLSLPGRVWGFDADRGALLFARTADVRSIAATSSRIYVGGYGNRRPVWAIDPFTGLDQNWALGFGFSPLSSTTGEYTTVTTLLLDGGRLYIGGAVRTDDFQEGIVVADAATGARVRWTPQLSSLSVWDLRRIGPAIVAAAYGAAPTAFDATSAATLPFTAAVGGAVTVAPAPEGVVVGGVLSGSGASVARAGLAAIDLDTWTVSPWTSALVLPQFGGVTQVDTDGTWLIALTREGHVAKIDPATGAVLGELPFPGAFGVPMRVRNGVVYIAYPDALGFGPFVWRAGAITIANWSLSVLPITLANGQPWNLDVDGDTMYLAGSIDDVNGVSRPGLAAVSISTGVVSPFRPNPDDTYYTRVLARGGRVWAAGGFRSIGGAARRGIAELDPATGAALPWQPDVPGMQSVRLDLGPDGDLYVGPDSYSARITPAMRAGGQVVPPILAFSTTTGQRRAWRHGESGFIAVTSDCVVAANGCLARTSAPPTTVSASVNASTLTLQWTLPPSTARTGLRLEFGSLEGRRDLYQVDLPATQTSFTSPAPPGRYVARVRSLDGTVAGPPSDDVSFAVGAGAVAAPLDATVSVERSLLHFAWRPPSTGAPQGYLLEVGSAPGLANLATLPLAGSSTGFQITAPAGRFWARLRAAQAGALSTPAPELFIAAATEDVAVCGSSPYAPDTLAASVSGGVVLLTWQVPSGGVTPVGYRLVAGTAPGLSDIATFDLGAVTAFSTPAPPGRYYVSIASLDACGASSGLSAAVTVTVP